ncbi:MAG: Ig-like domain-containing protein [Deltaproteobacteria bacterium]|nr:Ig-like domain-containing protein [Deltaproteobacteria bacterium]
MKGLAKPLLPLFLLFAFSGPVPAGPTSVTQRASVGANDLADRGTPGIADTIAPSNPSIPDGATAVSIRPPFAWQAVTGAIAYDLYLWKGGESKPATPTGKDMPGASMTLAAPLDPLTLYHWQVAARKASGMAAGPEWSFTTGYILAGDVNDDKAVDLRDGILVLRTVSGLNPAGIRPGYPPCGADANGDGTVGLADAVYILQTCAQSRADTVPPRVSSTEPADNAMGVEVDRTITAVFSEEMDSSTLTASTFTLNQGETYIAGTVSYNAVSRTAAFTPGAPLLAARAYTATISTGARDLAGNALAASHLFGFTTAGLSEVVRTSPMNGDRDVSVDYPWIQIAFASDMDGDSLMEAFTLTEAGGAPVAGTLTYCPPGELAILRFVPDAPLSPLTAYTGVLSTSAKSAGGIPIGSPYSFTFTTGERP